MHHVVSEKNSVCIFQEKRIKGEIMVKSGGIRSRSSFVYNRSRKTGCSCYVKIFARCETSGRQPGGLSQKNQSHS
jgi:hypothetical protein